MTFKELTETLSYAHKHYDEVAGDKLLYCVAASEEYDNVALILSGSTERLAGLFAFHASKDKDVATAILMAAEVIAAEVIKERMFADTDKAKMN